MNNENDSIKRALLVIDIQEDATGSTSRKLYENSKELISNVNSVIESSEKIGVTVVYIKHELKSNFLNKIIMGNRFIEGTPGSEIDSRIKIVSDYVYSKNKENAFSNPKLDNFLKQKGINEVFIVGLDASACVYRTSIGAIDKGYKVAVLEDAIVTSNMSRLQKILEMYKKKRIEIISIKKFKQISSKG